MFPDITYKIQIDKEIKMTHAIIQVKEFISAFFEQQ